MALSLLVICDARADFLISADLADRVLCEAIEWVEPDMLDHLRSFKGPSHGEPFLTWMRVKGLAREAGIRPGGFLEGEPADMDAGQARRALIYVESNWPSIEAILLIRDSDGLAERRRGLEQARNNSSLRQRDRHWPRPHQARMLGLGRLRSP